MNIDSTAAQAFNVVIVVGCAVVLLVMYLLTLRGAWRYRRADEMSMRLRLPFGTDATRDAVAAWMSRTSRWVVAAMAAGLLVLAPLLTTPLAQRFHFLFMATLPVLLIAGTTARVAVTMRERLFRPAPHVRRVARLRRMRVRDYFDPARRGAPSIFAALLIVAVAGLAVTWAAAPWWVDPAAATTAVVAAAVAALVLATRVWLDRLVLAQPQPAADTLELAWDDAIRTDTLSSIAVMACQLSGVAAALAVIATVDPSAAFSGLVMQLPTWAILVPQFLYLGWHGRRALRPGLYPDLLRGPVPAGSVA